MRFYHIVRSGITFKVNETFIELWQNSYESDKSSTTISFCPDDDEDDLGYSNLSHPRQQDVEDIFDDDISDTNFRFGAKCVADEASDENDSLLVAYDENSIDSLWQEDIIISA